MKVFKKLRIRLKSIFLEEDKYCNATSLEIFEDESKTKLSLVKILIQQFKDTFENALS